MRKQFYIPELACEHCARALEQVLLAVPGVRNVTVRLRDRVVDVHGEDPMNEQFLLTAIHEVGYETQKAL